MAEPARAELRPYEPTWADNLARLLLGDGRVSPERRRFVEGILGTSGLGDTDELSLRTLLVPETAADVALMAAGPAGKLAGKAVGKGVAAAGGALLALEPGEAEAGLSGAGRKGGRNIAQRVTDAVTQPQGIRAYHGSPHDFDRFDMSKIGTGEGAQAYGHGLYFAEAEDTARSYRDALSRDRQQFVNNRPLYRVYDETLRGADNLPSQKATLEYEKAQLLEDLMNVGDIPGAKKDGGYSSVSQAARDWFDKKVEPSFEPAGRMYEVNIRANPDKFLDWDKPLREQPEAIRRMAGWSPDAEAEYRAALRDETDDLYAELTGRQSGGVRRLPPPPRGAAPMDMTGAEFYESSRLVPGDYRDKVAATERLREAGIPGIRYLDQGSRAAGDGSRNYVVFDDALIDIIRKYGLASVLGLGAIGASQNGEAAPLREIMGMD